MKIYTRKGDNGTTGLLYGGRVAKDSTVIRANGAVDEAQAALGVARAAVEPGSELDELAGRPRAGPLRADGRAGHRAGQPAQAAPRCLPGDRGDGRRPGGAHR